MPHEPVACSVESRRLRARDPEAKPKALDQHRGSRERARRFLLSVFNRGIVAVVTVICLSLEAGSAAAGSIDEAEKREVRIPAGDVTLAATLYRPAGAMGDLPAVVTAHGSAPSDRQRMSDFTGLALDLGLAVLTFDKRGVGGSTGKFERFTVSDSPRQFHALSSDVAHSVRWLAAQPGIDEERIGLLGHSQAGWIMPLAASEEHRVKFIVSLSGVSISAGQEAIHGAYLQAVWKKGERPTWSQIYAANVLASEYTGDPGYDPAPVLEKIEVPTLWLWGLYDEAIPTIPSIDRVGQLMKAGKKNNYVHLLPYGSHSPRNLYTGQLYDFDVIRNWLIQIGILTRRF